MIEHAIQVSMLYNMYITFATRFGGHVNTQQEVCWKSVL